MIKVVTAAIIQRANSVLICKIKIGETLNNGVSVASSGIKEIYKDWIPEPNRLKPVTYKYRLKP